MPFFPDGLSCSRAGKNLFLLLVLCHGFTGSAFSQYNPASDQSGSDSLIRIYLSHIGEASLLYSGVQYIRNGQKTDGFPFFSSEAPLGGTVSIRGNPHSVSLLQLDLVTGQLITMNFAGTSLFVIEPSLVDSFVIDGHLFLSLPAAGATSGMRGGYYECLRAYGMTLYIHWEKKLQTRPGYDLSAYLSYDKVFLIKDNVSHSIGGRKDFLALLPDWKEEIKKVVRSEKLNFNKQTAETAASLFRHFQSSTR